MAIRRCRITVARAVIPLVMVALTLAGCAAPRPSGKSSHPIHVVDPSPSPSPTSTRPVLGDLIISTAGIGTLHVGAPVPAEPAPTALITWNPTACVSADLGIAAGDANAGAWVSAYPDILRPSGLIAPFIVVTTGAVRAGNVSVLWVWAGDIHTATGIRVGSTKGQLMTAYPAFAHTVSGNLSDVYVLSGVTGSLSFEVSKQNSDSGSNYWPDDEVNKVLWMGVALPGASPGPIAGSDAVPSPCPSVG